MPTEVQIKTRKAIGARVRRRRKILGLTLVQLAELAGCKLQQIQKYETGANEIGAVRLFELAEALDVDVQYFFQTLQDDLPDERAMVDEAGVIRAARFIAGLPPVVRERILALAMSVSELIEDDTASKPE